MRRDWELTRQIMLDVVNKTDYGGDPDKTVRAISQEVGEAKTMLHISWLVDEGLLEAVRVSETHWGATYPLYMVRRVTGEGQAFVEAVDADSGWKKFFSRVAQLAQEGVRVSIPVLLDVGLRHLIGSSLCSHH